MMIQILAAYVYLVVGFGTMIAVIATWEIDGDRPPALMIWAFWPLFALGGLALLVTMANAALERAITKRLE